MRSTEVLPPEPRWPAILGLLATSGLYVILPERLTAGPNWLLPGIAMAFLAASIVSHRSGRSSLNFVFGVGVSAVLTASLVWALAMLIAGLPGKLETPTELLRSAVALWVSNILVFASWYWRLDAGGPHERESRPSHEEGAFLFPQMTLKNQRVWRPGFVDYLFLAFNTSTAFSPTDVPVLAGWAKLLMMVQSSISLGTLAILAARAINIL
ncbi:MAG: hypothetical protein JOY54_01470 [Acidobacteriaceae bacterium]|nr:hypothetical protein [Acidobacteriaceae bacterium]